MSRCLAASRQRDVSHLNRNCTGSRARRTSAHSASYRRLHGNHRYDLSGPVFEHEFRSKTIESDDHLFEAVRYDVLTPVRARLCSHPELWRWSSYAATAGRRRQEFVAVERFRSLFGSDVAAFERYVAEAAMVR